MSLLSNYLVYAYEGEKGERGSQKCQNGQKGVIHKPRGHFFVYFDPPPPLSLSLLLNKAYVTKWS